MKSADKMLVNVIGDMMVASGAVSYFGAFTVRIYALYLVRMCCKN